MARVFMVPQVVPRPSVKSPCFYSSNIVRHQVIAERIPLVSRSPQLTSQRIDSESYPVADTGGKGMQGFTAFRVGYQHVGSIRFAIPRSPSPMLIFPKMNRITAFSAHPFSHV